MTVQQPGGDVEPSGRDHQARVDIRRTHAVLHAARRRLHGRAAVPVLARSSTATTTPRAHVIVYVDGEPAGVDARALVRVLLQARALRRAQALPLAGPLHATPALGHGVRGARRATPRPTCTASAGCGRSWSATASTRSTTRSSTSPITSTEPTLATSRSTTRRGRPFVTDPMVLNRPEDRLDAPGILEQSMDRGASNPHADHGPNVARIEGIRQ